MLVKEKNALFINWLLQRWSPSIAAKMVTVSCCKDGHRQAEFNYGAILAEESVIFFLSWAWQDMILNIWITIEDMTISDISFLSYLNI